ncbi:MAG: response regulator [Armatimonadia bacterium]
MPEQPSSWTRQGGKLLQQEQKIRLVITTLLVVFLLAGRGAITDLASVYLAVTLMVGSLLISLFSSRDQAIGPQQFQLNAVALTVLDLVAVTLLLRGTGGLHSGFFSLYLVSLIFAAAFFRGLELALLTALAALLYIGVSYHYLALGLNAWHLSARLIGMIVVAWYAYLLSGVLHREKENNDRLLRHLTEGVLLFDKDQKVSLVNSTLLGLLNREEGDIIGKTRADLAAQDNVMSWILGDVGSDADGFRTRIGCFPEADLPFIECTTIPCGLKEDGGGWVVVCKDLRDLKVDPKSTRRATCDKLAPLSNLRALSEALYGMAEYLDESKRWQAVEVIEKHTLALQAILAEMLHRGQDQKESLDLDFIDVSSLLANTRRLLEIQPVGEGLELEIFCQQGLPEVNADRSRLGQSLLQICKAFMAIGKPDDKLVIDVRSAERKVVFMLQLVNKLNPRAVPEALSEAEAAQLGELCDLPIFRIIEEHHGRWECSPTDVNRRVIFDLPISGPATLDETVLSEEAAAGERSPAMPNNWPLQPSLAAEVTNQLKNTLNVIRGYAEMSVYSDDIERLRDAMKSTIDLSDQASELVDVLQPSTGEFDLEVKLPEGAEEEAESMAIPETSAAVGEGAILVVDDDAAMRGLLVDLLHAVGYETIEANDGRAAVERIRLTPPALAFVDLSMPRVTGVEVMKEARKYLPGLPVVLMTGYATQVAVEALGDEKPYAILSKPFTIDDVLSLAKAVVGPPAARNAS